MSSVIDWPAASAAARAAGWKRNGGQVEGPCPACGGRNRAHLQPGDRVDVLGGCRRCNLTGIEIARALLGEANGSDRFARAPNLLRGLVQAAPSSGRPAARTGGDLERPARVWAAAGAVAGTPGAVYLGGRLGAPWAVEHPAIRWLSPAPAARVDLRPRLPYGAAGCLVYAFGVPGSGEQVRAVQVEAVDVAGVRVEFGRAGKRPSVRDSEFDAGARVFVARRPAMGRGVVLVEGPLDALAVSSGRQEPTARGIGVVGAAGTSGFQPAAVAAWPDVEVCIGVDGDKAGGDAAVRLAVALAAERRQWRIRRPGPGLDWCDWLEQQQEREAMRNG